MYLTFALYSSEWEHHFLYVLIKTINEDMGTMVFPMKWYTHYKNALDFVSAAAHRYMLIH